MHKFRSRGTRRKILSIETSIIIKPRVRKGLNSFYSDSISDVNEVLVGVRKPAGEASKFINVYTNDEIYFANDFPSQPLDAIGYIEDSSARMNVDKGNWMDSRVEWTYHFYCERELN